MTSQAWTVAKLNLTNLGPAYVTTACVFLLMGFPNVVQLVQAGPNEYFERSYLVSNGLVLYVLVVLAAVLVPAVHFNKIMHLGGRKRDYLEGTAMTYAVVAAAVSLANLVCNMTLDQSWRQTFQVINLVDLFGWADNGAGIAFLQQLVFLLVLAALAHTLATVQGSRAGWVVDLVLAGAVGLLVAIGPLRAGLVFLVGALTVHPSVWVQVASCVLVAAGAYAVNVAIVNRRTI